MQQLVASGPVIESRPGHGGGGSDGAEHGSKRTIRRSAHCIISGIRPQIAQTIVALGIEFGDIATKASLADALRLGWPADDQLAVAAARLREDRPPVCWAEPVGRARRRTPRLPVWRQRLVSC
jgi:hypothetical protein